MIQDNGYTITCHAGIKKIDLKWKGSYTQIEVYPTDGPMQAFDADGLDDYIEGLRQAASNARVMDKSNAYVVRDDA